MHRKIFLLDLKRLVILILVLLVSIIFHNIISGLLGFEEPVFFIIGLIIIPIYLFVAIVYTIVHHTHRKIRTHLENRTKKSRKDKRKIKRKRKNGRN